MKIATELTEERECIVLFTPVDLALVIVGLHNFARLARLASGGQVGPEAAHAATMALQLDNFLKEVKNAVHSEADKGGAEPVAGTTADAGGDAGGSGVLPVPAA